LGLDKKRLVYENKESSEFLNTFGKGLDMVFLDTHHQIENVISDFEKILPKLNEGADIFIHDTNANPEMGKQLREYLDGTKLYSHESIDKSCGLMIATYKGVPNV
jgi:predicted O-methyltransferase YrrM